MSDYIHQHARPIDRALLSDMLSKDGGEAVLEIKTRYLKDTRQRGVYVSVYRALAYKWGASYDIMNRHNGRVLITPMDRKPSAKVAAAIAAKVESNLDAIAAIALASDSPDWQAIAALFKDN